MAARQQWTRLQNRWNGGLDRVSRRSPEQINAGQLAFWNGPGGDTWVARQEHTDITLAPVTEALLASAAPHTGERVLDIGCGCGATTLEFARAVGPPVLTQNGHPPFRVLA
jgi:2-polyprenyl-3-methyl-5-hydroxy-6-metoxy-1,4-benzoquinol methylase